MDVLLEWGSIRLLKTYKKGYCLPVLFFLQSSFARHNNLGDQLSLIYLIHLQVCYSDHVSGSHQRLLQHGIRGCCSQNTDTGTQTATSPWSKAHADALAARADFERSTNSYFSLHERISAHVNSDIPQGSLEMWRERDTTRLEDFRKGLDNYNNKANTVIDLCQRTGTWDPDSTARTQYLPEAQQIGHTFKEFPEDRKHLKQLLDLSAVGVSTVSPILDGRAQMGTSQDSPSVSLRDMVAWDQYRQGRSQVVPSFYISDEDALRRDGMMKALYQAMEAVSQSCLDLEQALGQFAIASSGNLFAQSGPN